MKNYYLLLVLLGLGCCPVISQNIDSLWYVWQNAEYADSLRLESLESIISTENYYATNFDSTLVLTELMRNFAHKKGLYKWEANAYYFQGLAYYFITKNYQKAIELYQKSLEINRRLDRKKNEAYNLNNIAVAYKLIGNLAQALEYNLQALEIRKEIANEQGVVKSLQNISSLYYNQEKYQEALEYALEGFELSEQIGSETGLANNALSAGNAYAELGNFQEALRYFNDALVYYIDLGQNKYQATCYDNIGNVYVKLKEYPKALSYQKKGLQIREAHNIISGLALSYINLGSTYFILKQYERNINSCGQGLAYAEKAQDSKLIYHACECLYDGYHAKGAFSEALNFYKRYVAVKDSVEEIKQKKELEEIESKFELKEKEARLSQQELDLIYERNARSKTILISLGIIAGIGILFAILRSRLRQKRQDAELEAELERAEARKLRELDQLKSNFFANISHEFRTPLTLIMSPLEQMLAGNLKGDQHKYQRIMYRNGQRLQDLINQLLDLSKLESGHLQLNLQEGKLSQFLRATAFSFSSLADRKQIEYQVLGPARDVLAEFDQDILEKILMNLISNAFKFTQEEGRILVAYRIEEDELSIVVEDSGIGIPQDELNSIFDRFYSLDNSSDLQKSSGIGLALTKELIDLYEGRISVESQEGKGSSFKVRLPVKVRANAKVQNSASGTEPIALKTVRQEAPTTIPTAGSLELPKVLIVEDNQDVRNYLKEQLMDTYQIFDAIHGKMGLKMAKEQQPDLIVSDVMMPEMDGNELCKRLKTDALTSHIPVILLTAKAEQGDKLEGLETGADAYLTKPFDHAELQIRIRNLIEQRKQLRAKFRSDFRFAPSEVTVNSLDEAFLEKIRSEIEANLEDEAFSVVELSKEIGMSRSNLFRKLKALTNQSPNQVIREMRLIRAKELLEKGGGNATEVAFMVGFNSATYFSKCFRDYFGISPSQIG